MPFSLHSARKHPPLLLQNVDVLTTLTPCLIGGALAEEAKCQSDADSVNMLHKLMLILGSDHLD